MNTREILFRGKAIGDGNWVYGCPLANESKMAFYWLEPDGKMNGAKVDPETVGQFTGLLDKNGVKIFEGDIVRINTHHLDLVSEDFEYRYDNERGYAHYVVKWVSTYCKFHMALEKYTKMEPRCKTLNVYPHHNVVGNIHDNPELLKGAE